MYLDHFKLSERPFSITPDPRFLYMSARHREALAHLLYGLGEGGGFVQLTGEVGTGKTTICRCLLEQVPDNVDLAVVLNPKVTSAELIATVCDELGIEYREENASIKMLTDVLNRYLLEAHANGRRTVLIIDEAQNLSADVLEQVRLLTNLETPTQKLLQIILIGQPELRALLHRDDMRQLAQRVTARYHLEPISREEAGAYIKHRLHVCGATGTIFTNKAVDQVFRLSGGIPRLINVLCDRAMLGAYVEGKSQIDKALVQRASKEVLAGELEEPRAGSRYGLAAAGVAMLALIGAGIYGYWQYPGTGAALFSRLGDRVVAPSRSMPDGQLSAATQLPQTAAGGRPGAIQGVAVASNAASESRSLAEMLLASDQTYDRAAWKELFALWSIALPSDGTPGYCDFANDQGLGCLAEQGSWEMLRQYNRPVIMQLVAADGRRVPVVLRHLDDSIAELVIGNELYRLTIGQVDRYWYGDFTLLVQTPPDGRLELKVGDRGSDVAWLRQRLEETQQVKLSATDPQYFDFPLQKQVLDFQRNQGLTPDGIVGKYTLIQLESYVGRDVPLLSTETS
ncbi:MAG: AAA family ATPase [Gammaproteobacteria bacterium]